MGQDRKSKAKELFGQLKMLRPSHPRVAVLDFIFPESSVLLYSS